MLDLMTRSAAAQGWLSPEVWWRALTDATSLMPSPVAVIAQDALAFNTRDTLVRAGGVPIRVASKSIRVRAVLDSVLAIPGYQGILAFTLPEALWLSETHDDIVMGYPTTDRAALLALLADDVAASRVTLMVDDVAQLDLIDALVAPHARPVIRVAIDADASWRAPAFGHIGGSSQSRV